MKFTILTLGCKVNAYESSAMKEILLENGYCEAKDDEISDVAIINTCSVTHVSDAKSRQMIRKMIKLNPNCIIAVVGCYSQMFSDIVKEIEGVNIVIGTKYRNQIYYLIEEYKKNKKQIVKVDAYDPKQSFENMNVTPFLEKTRAFLKIQDGCNNFCTYCIIPYARGPQRSRDKEDIFNEVYDLLKKGYKEIVLTGIHTGSYGFENKEYRLSDLIEDLINKFDNLKRIRISSIEVIEIDDKLIDLISRSKVIVDHLHMPLQAGSDEILKLMNRHYDINYFINKVNDIRKKVPDIAITTDVIVGFPNETDELFKTTVENIKKINFSQLHVFPYSPRKGTIAATMKNQIDPKVKKERVQELLNLSRKLQGAYIEKFIGKELSVIFETIDSNGNLVGHSSNYIKVIAKGNIEDINVIKNVKITSFLDGQANGIIL